MDDTIASTSVEPVAGYVLEETYLDLVFEDRPGLRVRVLPTSLGEIIRLSKLASIDMSALMAGDPAAMAQMEELFSSFAAQLVEWTIQRRLADEIIPVPATLAGLYSLDAKMVMAIIQGWLTDAQNGGVDAPLADDSSSGGTSPAPPLPMVARSPARPSTRKPRSGSARSKGSAATPSPR
jgi:hypothetical protein